MIGIGIEAIRAALKLAGVETPAFGALMDAVIKPLPKHDQDAMKREYDAALADADAAHRDAQSL